MFTLHFIFQSGNQRGAQQAGKEQVSLYADMFIVAADEKVSRIKLKNNIQTFITQSLLLFLLIFN